MSEWAVASCVTAAVGCGPEPLAAGQQRLGLTEDGPWESVTCPDLLLVTDPVRPAQAFDYLGVFMRGSVQGDVARLSSDVGNPCQGARDRAACVAAVKERVMSAALGDTQPPAVRGVFALTTSGDDVTLLEDAAALARVLGPIDTHSEALLIAQLAGLRHACSGRAPYNSIELGTYVQTTSSGYRVKSTWQDCGVSNGKQQLEVFRDGTFGPFEVNELTPSACAIGRRPQGLVLDRPRAGCEPLARLLAECAQLEAASVPAFVRLARELCQLGAPGLAREARRSARDEVRHARRMQLLAARYHARTGTPEVPRPSRSRSAAEIARDNAAEGCVRETFGALIAWQQAATARDPVVAQVMREIAVDETRHAELSWAIARWLEPQLSARERREVAAARSGALAQLSAEIASESLPSEARALIGWPSALQQQALLQRMAAELELS